MKKVGNALYHSTGLGGVWDEVRNMSAKKKTAQRNDDELPINIRSKPLTGTAQWSIILPWMSERYQFFSSLKF
jgi:hypothetical protein